MGAGTSPARSLALAAPACRLLVRKEKGLTEILEFAISGLEVGQQVVTMAGPTCLKDLACGLSDHGLRPEALLRNGRLIFLTAPDCLPQLAKLGDPFERSPLRLNGSVLRWISDWSWAYANGAEPGTVLGCQRRIHAYLRSLTALSVCTVHCEKLERSSLLAMLANHRGTQRTA